jgi:hypothetical protein
MSRLLDDPTYCRERAAEMRNLARHYTNNSQSRDFAMTVAFHYERLAKRPDETHDSTAIDLHQAAPSGAGHTRNMDWQPIVSAPYERDIELAVIDHDTEVHALAFPCHRTFGGWGQRGNAEVDRRAPDALAGLGAEILASSRFASCVIGRGTAVARAHPVTSSTWPSTHQPSSTLKFVWISACIAISIEK